MFINVKRKIKAPSDSLWNYLSDFANIHRFHPLLSGSHYTEESQSCEIGATRQCDFKDGNYLKERITDLQEGSHYTVEIYGTSMPVKNASATLGLQELGPNLTEVYMKVEMESKYKILSPLMYILFQYIAGPGILRGLEKLYRSESKVQLVNI